MGLVVAVVLCAVVTGLLLGGGLHRAAALPVRTPRLVVVAVLVQLVGGLLGGAAHGAGLLLSALLALLFLARNRALPGVGLVAAGLLTNALVVLANGAMPVSAAAAARAGLDAGELALQDDPRHEPETPGTRLRLLGDVVPVPLPLRPEVVSPGDVAVAAGLGQLVVTALVGLPRTRARGGAPGPAPRARRSGPVRPRSDGRPAAPRPPRPRGRRPSA